MEEKKEQLLIFERIDDTQYEINNKHYGNIGRILFHQKWDVWLFEPIDNFLYRGIHLAIIIKFLNGLNGYVKKEK